MFCSIIVVCKDNLADVKSTLLSILIKKNIINDVEVLVVDDSANNDIEEFIKSFNSEKIRFFRGDGISLYSAMNIGIRNSQGKYLWFLNSGD